MSDNTILDRNLLALSSSDPSLSVAAGSCDPHDDIMFIMSKNDYPVPAQVINGIPIPFHSKIDPLREAEKYLSMFDGSGYIVFLGLGAGYHITGFLQKPEVSNILIIERDISVFRSLIGTIDFTSIIADPRVKILIDEQPAAVTAHILKSYFPVIAGNLKTISLGARVNIEKEYFQYIVDGIKEIIDTIVDDYAVQAKFGRKWFINTLHNLRLAEASTVSIPPIRKAIITGAGPSLENQIEEIQSYRKNGALIATDTSLPALLRRNIIPDIVISIDCQQISYHHFISGLPEGIPLVLDLASPPLLARLARKAIFFSSGHPFSQYISRTWRNFPSIDTSGGNVSHAALSLASCLGADEVMLAGLDFSFPEGKSYARGTYIYALFQSIDTRTIPAETLFYSFIFNNKNLVKESVAGSFVYTTHAMQMYKKKMEAAISAISSRVIPLKGTRIGNVRSKVAMKNSSVERNIFSQGPSLMRSHDFLRGYVDKLSNLNEPRKPVVTHLFSLENEERELWITLLPLATWIREYHCEKYSSDTDLLAHTRDYAVAQARQFL